MPDFYTLVTFGEGCGSDGGAMRFSQKADRTPMVIRRELVSGGASLEASVNFNAELKLTDASVDA